LSAPAEIDIIATDDASDVFQEVSNNFTDMSSNVSEASEAMSSDISDSMQQTSTSVSTMTTTVQADTSQMQDSFNEAGSTAQVSMNQITTSTSNAGTATAATNLTFTQGAMQMNMMAMSGVMLYNSVSNVENSEVSLSRAHLVEEKAANSVTLAQQTYNKAVAEYGANSLQAEDAANKLSLAEQTQQVDVQRVGDAQRNYNSSLLNMAVSIIPMALSTVTTLSLLTEAGTLAKVADAGAAGVDAAAYGIWTAATYVEYGAQMALNAIMDANPIMIVVLAVTALAAIFFVAYEKCAPFRAALNEIGSVLEGAFKSAVDDVKDVLNFLWNSVIEPGISILTKLWDTITSNPILSALFGPITTIAYLVEHWSDVTKAVGSVLSWLWNDILTPVANFFKTTFVDAFDIAMVPIKAFETAINAVANAVKPLSSFIGDLGSALGKLCFAHAAPAAEEFNKQITQSLALTDQLSHKTNTLGSSLMGLSGNVKLGTGSGQSNVNIASPNITIGSVTGAASLKQTRDAVSKGICDAMYKKGIMNKVT
jgi:hypothetical protein